MDSPRRLQGRFRRESSPKRKGRWRNQPSASDGGTADRISFQGSLNECHVKVGPAVIRSNLHPSSAAKLGDEVWVSLDPKRCVVFAA